MSVLYTEDFLLLACPRFQSRSKSPQPGGSDWVRASPPTQIQDPLRQAQFNKFQVSLLASHVPVSFADWSCAHLGSSGERQMARLADEDSRVLRDEPRVQKGEVPVQVFDLALATLQRV